MTAGNDEALQNGTIEQSQKSKGGELIMSNEERIAHFYEYRNEEDLNSEIENNVSNLDEGTRPTVDETPGLISSVDETTNEERPKEVDEHHNKETDVTVASINPETAKRNCLNTRNNLFSVKEVYKDIN